jgi:hypothetical protein
MTVIDNFTFLDIYDIKDYKVFIVDPDTLNVPRNKKNNEFIGFHIVYEKNIWEVVGIEHNALAGKEYVGNIGLVCKLWREIS